MEIRLLAIVGLLIAVRTIAQRMLAANVCDLDRVNAGNECRGRSVPVLSALRAATAERPGVLLFLRE